MEILSIEKKFVELEVHAAVEGILLIGYKPTMGRKYIRYYNITHLSVHEPFPVNIMKDL